MQLHLELVMILRDCTAELGKKSPNVGCEAGPEQPSSRLPTGRADMSKFDPVCCRLGDFAGVWARSDLKITGSTRWPRRSAW